MSVASRLSEAYNNAHILSFDSKSKYILMSDVHRGDGSWADDFGRNENAYRHALEYYFREGYSYIELGDGDELWENSSFPAIINAHSNTFGQLKKYHQEKRLHLIYGNHDLERSDKNVVARTLNSYYEERTMSTLDLFPGIEVHEAIRLVNSTDHLELFLFHGHQGYLFEDNLWQVGRFFTRHLWRHLQLIGINDPTSAAENISVRTEVEQNISKWAEAQNRIVICGHTHRPRFGAPYCSRYYNTGSAVHPRSITGLEIENNKITLVKWSVESESDGLLRVTRTALAGPKDLTIQTPHPQSHTSPEHS